MRTAIKKQKPVFFGIKNSEEDLTYELLQQYKEEQNKLISCGVIKHPKRIIRDFTQEEQAEFDKGLTIEKVFADLDENML